MTGNEQSQTDRDYFDEHFKGISDKLIRLEYLVEDHRDSDWVLIESFIDLFEEVYEKNEDIFSISAEEIVRDNYKQILDKFKDVLEGCGVIFHSADVGDDYDPTIHEMRASIECPPDKKELVGKIARIYSLHSYEYHSNVRKQEVSVYR